MVRQKIDMGGWLNVRVLGLGFMFSLLLVSIALVIYFRTKQADNYRSLDIVQDRGLLYLNTARDVRYVGSEQCQPCHAEIYESYIETQTGRSMVKMDTTNTIEVFPQEEAAYDSVNNFYYEMVRQGDKFYQREYRLGPDGNVMHERWMEAQYVMGSGVNLRNYFYDENGMFYQLPLSWFENEVKWDLSPGYRGFGNVRFNRFSTARCFFCHNSYLQESPTAIDRYVKPYPLGIGCERCHGPGELHVKQMQGEEIDLPSENARTIVNPSKLSPQRRLDVCGQCHLQGKSRALRGDHDWFDFKPGMLLEAHHSEYFPDEIHIEAFKVANTAYRLSLSECFAESHGATNCSICHDSHGPPETSMTEYQNENCQKCHLPENLPGEGSRFTHTASDNCVPCHMNQTDSDNTLHGVINTDHWIRVDANMTPIDWSIHRKYPQKKPLIKLVPYLDAKDEGVSKRLGIAYLNYYKESDNRTAYLDSALKYLSHGLSGVENDAVGRSYLGDVLLRLGRIEEAIVSLKRATALKPDNAQAYFNLGEAYRAEKNLSEAIRHYRRASELMPDEPRYLESLGMALADGEQFQEAVSILERSLNVDTFNPHTYYTLGNLYALTFNNPAQALPYYKTLVVLDPDFPNGYLNLGSTYSLLGNYEEAIRTFEKEVFVRPKSANGYINLGRVLSLTGRISDARQAYQKALEIDPSSGVARGFLSNLPE